MADNLPHVTRRFPATETAQQIADAIVSRGTDTETVANAADMPVSVLEERLSTGDFTMTEIVRVGGVLHMSPSDLYGAAS
jgi:hypothetical protein